VHIKIYEITFLWIKQELENEITDKGERKAEMKLKE
jgi:hypothetical protein